MITLYYEKATRELHLLGYFVPDKNGEYPIRATWHDIDEVVVEEGMVRVQRVQQTKGKYEHMLGKSYLDTLMMFPAHQIFLFYELPEPQKYPYEAVFTTKDPENENQTCY